MSTSIATFYSQLTTDDQLEIYTSLGDVRLIVRSVDKPEQPSIKIVLREDKVEEFIQAIITAAKVAGVELVNY